MEICIFGDSITYGAFDAEKGGWVNRLRLHLDKTDFDGEVYNLGVSGDNTEGILNRLENEASFRQPEMIIFAIGTNDSQWLINEKRNRIPLEQFEKNINSIISMAEKFTSDLVFVGLTPVDEDKTAPIPWDENKMYKNSFIAEYNGAIEKICEESKIKFIELFSGMMKTNYKDLLYDGLHPDSEGHNWIYKKVIDELNY